MLGVNKDLLSYQFAIEYIDKFDWDAKNKVAILKIVVKLRLIKFIIILYLSIILLYQINGGRGIF